MADITRSWGNYDTRYLQLDGSNANQDIDIGEHKITSKENISVNSGTITRVDGLVTEITIGGREVTINRDVDDVITGWEDEEYETTLTRVDGKITGWEVVAK